MNDDRVAPVKDGEMYEVNIGAVGGKGDGIAKVKGFVIFVKDTKKGDYVKIKVTKVLQNAAFGEVVKKLEKPARRSSKFATVSQEEFEATEEEYQSAHEDTEDFGEDLDEE